MSATGERHERRPVPGWLLFHAWPPRYFTHRALGQHVDMLWMGVDKHQVYHRTAVTRPTSPNLLFSCQPGRERADP